MSGFVYIWYDSKHKRFYIGSHWGSPNDGYICSSPWMRQAYKHRPEDFRRKFLAFKTTRQELLSEEQRWLSMIKDHELKTRYYNLSKGGTGHWSADPKKLKTVAQKSGATRKGKPLIFSDPEERGRKISEAKKGAKFTAEHREKLRQAKLGTTRSEEWKKTRAELIKVQWASGIRKSGDKMWITDGTTNRMVHKTTPIEAGWYQGRSL